MIDIKQKNGSVRCSVEITDKCVYHKELMTEEYVLLSFESDTLIPFAKGDYIDTEFGTFRIVHLEKPAESANGGYEYEQKFHVDWERFRSRIVFYDRQLGYEKAWKMTQRPEYFLDIIASNIYDEGFGRYSIEVDASLTEMKLVEFDGTKIIDALTKIAETWETEWWITNKVIHLGKCEYGSAVSLAVGDALSDMDPDNGQDQEYITRLYAFGSTRNLRKNYRKNDDGEVVVEGVVETRLKLPAGVPYVDAWPNMADEDVVEGIAIFDEVYPHRIGELATVTTKQYTDTIENEDGTETKEQWNAFRFTDTGLKFSKEYVIEGEELRIIFQSGKLAGMDFAVTFNPDGLNESDSKCQVFEIVRNEDYGIALPTDDFKPSVDDTYILYGYDTKFIADKLESAAEDELYTKAIAKVAKTSEDKSVYTCPTNPIRCAGYKENSVGKMVYNAYDVIDLDVGQCVTLRSNNYFANGYRTSRVRAFEKNLANKFVCTYTIGESSIYSKREELSQQVEELTYQSKQFANVYGSSVYVVKRYDKTAPSDHNVFSSTRARYEFLQKNVPDRAHKKITFDEGIDLGDYLAKEQGGHLDGKGNAELLSLVVRHLLSSARFVNGFNGEGFQLWVDGNNISSLEIDKLTVRQIMTVFELIISRIRAVGGQVIVSSANGKIKTVEDTGEAYKITFEGDNYFIAHDLMRCQVFNGVTEDGVQSPIRGYWVEVLAVDGNSILVQKSEFDEYETEPIAGDECVLMGNTENELRQNFISISATEDGQPRIDIMDGVKSKTFADCLRARLGNLDGISDNWFPADNQPHGNGLYADNAYLRGTFLLTTGEDIKTKFEVIEGKITQSVEGLRQDFMQEKGFLANPTFDGLNHWDTQNETVFFLVGNKWVWANKNVLTKQGDGATVISDDGRRVVRIRNKYITQTFENLRSVPEVRTNMDGLKEPAAVYLSFFYKVRKAGTLTIGFENVDDAGFVEYEHFAVNQAMEVTDTYQQFTVSGLWNATGDFKLAFTGEMCLYMLVLSTDRIETLTNTYKTLFEQSERLVKISAAVFDKNDALLKETGLVIRPEGAGLYAQDGDGNVGLIGVSVEETGEDGATKTVIKLTADNIQLEGLVTANGNFKILEDGSIETTNGKFTGEINAQKGYIGGFLIAYNHIGKAIVTGKDENGNDIIKDDNNGLFLYDDMIGFNGTNRQAIFGTWSTMGFDVLCRMYDNVKSWMPRQAMSVSVTGSCDDNIAIEMGGGYISGLNEKIVSYGFDPITNETQPTRLDVNLDRSIVNVYVSTQFYWRKQATDSNGNPVDYSTKTRNVYLNLPPVKQYDDGHIIRIRRAINSGSTVYIVPGKSYRLALTDGWNDTYTETEGNSVILTGADTYKIASSPLTIAVGETVELVFLRDLSVTINNVKYQGVWVKL